MRNIRVRCQAGFSFVEVMVVILLLGVMATILIPNFNSLRPGYERRAFVAGLNNLLMLGWRDALISQRLHRLLFDLKKRTVRLQAEIEEKDGSKKFYDVQTQYTKSDYQWPENIMIKQLFVGSEEQLQRPGIKTETTWFFIVPEGLSQDVIINAVDTKDRANAVEGVQIGLVINPFTVQLKAYDTFQKP